MKIIDTQGRPIYDPKFYVIEPTGRVFMSALPRVATAITLMPDSRAYFVYVGRTSQQLTVKYIEFYVSTFGVGDQTAEVGLYSSPMGPNKAAQVMTKITATGTVDSLTSTGIKRNTNSFDQVIAVGTYLWAGIRVKMFTSNPAVSGLCLDLGTGFALSAVTYNTPLTSLETVGGQILAIGAYLNTPVAPDLRVTLD